MQHLLALLLFVLSLFIQYRDCVQRALFIGLLFVFIQTAQARGPYWMPKRVLGSAELRWSDVKILQVPGSRTERLDAAIGDFVGAAQDRGLNFEVIERTGHFSKNSLVLQRVDGASGIGGGFTLRREGSRAFLRASNEAGWVNGLYTLADRAFGARWYWPEEIGYELVSVFDDTVPTRGLRVRPSFVQRRLHPVGTAFARRNRLKGVYSFNHNLARIFTPEVFQTTPEAFAEIGGKRAQPRKSAKYDPQPNFTSEAAVRLSAEAARDFFDAHPEANSFSLSINDNSLFDESAATEAVVAPLEYFRGLPNYTDLVFGYMNAVAEEVFRDPAYWNSADGAPRYLTALAYYWTEQSPSFKLHPRVMPVLTADRAQWHDPIFRREDRALIERWAGSGAERIATWDYYFGAPYPYPRQFTEQISESIPFLHDQGIDVFFSQLPSLWGLDGPKAWLSAQLLWDADQDSAVLQEEYFLSFFGAAAEPMRAFYELAERRRSRTAGAAKWIKFYKDEAGIELFDAATMRKLRDYLESAAGLVTDDGRRAERVAIVSQVFAFSEAYHAYQVARRALVESSFQALQSATNRDATTLASAWTELESCNSNLQKVRAELKAEPLHKALSAFDRIFQSDPRPLALAAIAESKVVALDFLDEDAAALLGRFRGVGLETSDGSELIDNSTLRHSGSERRNFLGPEIPVMPGWNIKYRAAEGLDVRSARGTIEAGLFIHNADIVSVDQRVPVLGERVYLLEIEADWRVSPDNRTWVQLFWRDSSDSKLRTDLLLRLPSVGSGKSGTWRFILGSPTHAEKLKLLLVTNRQYPGDFLELKRLSLKDLGSLPVQTR